MMHFKTAAGLALLTFIVFFSVVSHDFINYDTRVYIHTNAHVNSGLSWENVKWAFTNYHVSNWHPITWLSHMLDVSFFGLEPGGHHAINLLFHIINVLLLFQLLYIMTGERWPAAFIAAMFAIHPAHVESVAWVAERKDMLSTFFMLLTLFAYRRYTLAPSIWRYALVTLLFALGLMAKPMLVTLPFVLLLFDYWPLGRFSADLQSLHRRAAALVYEKLPLLFLAMISAIITVYGQREGGAMDAGVQLDLLDRVGNAVVAYGHYARSALVPAGLSLYYPHPGLWPTMTILTNLSILAVISTASVIWIRRFPWFFTGWAFFLGTLVPVIGIVQVGDQAYADRYTYIPFIGLFIALTFGIREIITRYDINKKILQYGAISLLILYSIVSIQYISHWKNSITLWTHVLLVTDEDYPVIIGAEQGTVDRSDRSLLLFKAYYSLGTAYFEAEQYAMALVHLNEAIALHPRSAKAHYIKAHSLFAMGRRDKAMESFEEARKLDPDSESLDAEIRNIRQALLKHTS